MIKIKKIMSLVLAFVLFSSVFTNGPMPVFAVESEPTLTDVPADVTPTEESLGTQVAYVANDTVTVYEYYENSSLGMVCTGALGEQIELTKKFTYTVDGVDTVIYHFADSDFTGAMGAADDANYQFILASDVTFTAPGSTTTETEKTDEATGVIVSAELPEDVTLIVSEKSVEESGLNTAAYPVSGASLFYDVKMYQDNAEYQAENGVTVTFPEAAITNSGLVVGDRYKVYHIHDGATDVTGPYEYTGGSISADFANLSVVGIAEADTAIDLVAEHGEATVTYLDEYIVLTSNSDSLTLYDGYESNVYTAEVTGTAGIEVEAFMKVSFADGFVLYQYAYYGDDADFKTVANTYQFISAADVTDGTEEQQSCAICGKENCTVAHLYCDVCSKFDCGQTHTHENPYKPVTTPVIPSNPQLTGAAVSIVDAEGTAVTGAFELYEGEKASLSAWSSLSGASYQWQIRYDAANDLWADIHNQTGKGILISPATVNSMIRLTGSAMIRCQVTSGTTVEYSAAIPVTVAQGSSASAAMFSVARTAGGTATYADTPELSDYTIVINYVFENNETVAQPYTATLAAGSNFSATVKHPSVMGYLPYVGESTETSTEIELNITSIQEDVTYTVTYKPTNVNYTVIHYQQNLDNDNYSIAETEPKTGLTKSTVPEVAKTYTGFYALLYEKPTIAADGSTVVEIYYDRNYYLVNFNLDGGYGTEPVYARYGAPLTAATPTKAGYTFLGWSLNGTDIVELPKAVGGNVTYKALWQANDLAKVSIVIWGENADNEEYSYIKTGEFYAKPGETINFAAGNIACGYEEHTHSSACYNCGNEEHTHGATCCTVIEHTHSADCCQKAAHTHNGDCCTIEEHTHSVSCCNAHTGLAGLVHLGGLQDDCNTGNCNNQTEHTHGDGNCVYCDSAEHTHGDGNCVYCNTAEHTHDEDCFTCTKTEHSHSSNCYMIDPGMDSNLWVLKSSDTVTVAANGSTVMNVYYDRTTFTLTFRANGNTVATITDKWGALISDEFEKAPFNTTYNGRAWKCTDSDKYGYALQTLDRMPQFDATFNLYDKSSNTLKTIYYYLENVGANVSHTTWPDNTTNFTLLKEVDTYFNFATYEEEYHEIEGFTRYSQSVSGFSGSDKDFSSNEMYLYYLRNSYQLDFHDGYNIAASASVEYQAPLPTFDSYIPDVPEAYEEGSVEFGGWYLSPDCSGEEFVLNEQTMPLGNLILYAKWVPVTHKVEFYMDQAAWKAGTKLTTHPDVTVSHGEKVTPTPAKPTNGEYKFVAWFYMDNGEEKAFDFANMPVNKDLQVYGKWSSDVLKAYHVYFKVQGTDTQIADPVTGSAPAATVKTFDAKGGTDLYVDYQEGYFPLVKSHSLTLDINDESKNTFTFWYVEKNAVPYTVYYVTETQKNDSQTPIELDGKTYYIVAPTYTNNENRKAVVTEKFVPVNGYMPDAYQKRLVVDGTDEADNKIIFIYSEDTTHAYYKITHYTENLDGKTWTEYASSQAVGNIGDTYTADSLTIDGFTYDSSINGTQVSGKLTANGLELKLYYVRNEYPYEVRYLEQDTGKQLATPKIETGKYGQVISESDIDIVGYTAVAPTSQTMVIMIESTADAKRNIITFYYVEKEATISYVVVGPNDCGAVSLVSETVKVLTGTAAGSTATANKNYRFVGWYSDIDCTQKVSDDAAYVPTKPDDGWTDVTYYTKFELAVVDLTITKNGWNRTDEHQSFIFDVTGPDNFKITVTINGNGEVTIKDLPIGIYTVEEITDWSWRYTPADNNQTIPLVANGENEVTFANNRSSYWLLGDSYCENWWGDGVVKKRDGSNIVIEEERRP